MLIEADAKQLELVAAAYLSKDPVLLQEINNGFDIHADNQRRFGLPTRLVAKTFVFRLLYGGSAFSYANDPNFAFVSSKERFWANIIAQFYRKYSRLEEWHREIVSTVIKQGYLDIPTGRRYVFDLDKNGNPPRTKVLNYPVQGFAADIMSAGRVALRSKIRHDPRILFVSTVHDSILLDVGIENVAYVCSQIKETWEQLSGNFSGLFVVQQLPRMTVEITVGRNWGSMYPYHFLKD